MEDLLKVGVITTTHGVRGEVKVFPTTDDPERFLELEYVLLDTGKEHRRLDISRVKFFKNLVILKFDGVDNINDIEKYKGCDLWIPREEGQPLGENEYCCRALAWPSLPGTIHDASPTDGTSEGENVSPKTLRMCSKLKMENCTTPSAPPPSIKPLVVMDARCASGNLLQGTRGSPACAPNSVVCSSAKNQHISTDCTCRGCDSTDSVVDVPEKPLS